MNGLKVVVSRFLVFLFPVEGSGRNPDLLRYPAGKHENRKTTTLHARWNYYYKGFLFSSLLDLILSKFPVSQLVGFTIIMVSCFQLPGLTIIMIS